MRWLKLLRSVLRVLWWEVAAAIKPWLARRASLEQ